MKRPLADRMRPRDILEVIGQPELTGEGGILTRILDTGQIPSMIIWGPPGTGKTTLAHIMASALDVEFIPFSAVLGGVKEVRAIIATAETLLRESNRRTILFVDEIHRFNKAQQDAFLPHVERGIIIFIGATTENPSFEVNRALLSRTTVVRLNPLEPEGVVQVLERAVRTPTPRGLGLDSVAPEVLELIARASGGDARKALGYLEQTHWAASRGSAGMTPELVMKILSSGAQAYDKSGDNHYDTVSAFIKSLRASDPDAALYWLAVMLEGGEDPLFIIRRMIIFASEDVGNSDPRALQIAVDCLQAVNFIGLPEARITMAQATTYLATAPKSNASYLALNLAQAALKRFGVQPVPMHLRNAPTDLMKEMGAGRGYQYPHDQEGGVTDQQCLPRGMEREVFYQPVDRGYERRIREMMAWKAAVLKHRREGNETA